MIEPFVREFGEGSARGVCEGMHRAERESRSRYLVWRSRCFGIGSDRMNVVEMAVRWAPIVYEMVVPRVPAVHVLRADSSLRSAVQERRCAVVELDWEQLV